MSRVDSHCHLADPRLAPVLDEVLQRAKSAGFSTFVQGGVNPQDWKQQLALQQKMRGLGLELVPTFGLHPYRIAEVFQQEQSQGEAALSLALSAGVDELAKCLSKAKGVGEIGLDYRPSIAQGSEAFQKEAFAMQLELAGPLRLPVVLHLVRAHSDALMIWDLWAAKTQKGMVHAFNGTAPEAEAYLKRGLMISVGGPLCRPDNRRLQQAVGMIPLENLCLESDSPDQAPPHFPSPWNEPTSILQVAARVAQLKKLAVDEVLDRTSANTRKLFSL